MTLPDFLRHWGLTENPFLGEEARADEVFARMSGQKEGAILVGPDAGVDLAARHADFDKILGDLRRPSGAVVFGEKGSGKTAIRLQIERRIQQFNAANPGAKSLFVPYDDLNGALDRLHERLGSKTALDSLQKMRMVDHLDAILHAVVPRLIDAVMGEPHGTFVDVGDMTKPQKRLDLPARRDLLLLQAIYDRPDRAAPRTARLRSRLRILPPGSAIWGRLTLVAIPLAIVATWWWTRNHPPAWLKPTWSAWTLIVMWGLYAIVALKIGVWDRLAILSRAHRIRRQIRVVARGDISYASSLRQLSRSFLDAAQLPVTDSDEPRFAMLDRLRRVLRVFGYNGLIVVMDRVDEPTAVSGDPDRMKAVVWPMLSNKLLQQEGLGLKMLLPMELRHALYRESSAFFQTARLDKQSMIDRLAWTGATLFDLCEQRLNTCRRQDLQPMSLLDIFAEDVTRQELSDALERLHQPRDAFKMLYRCILEHCSMVPRSEAQWRIPRSVLLNVMKAESERVQQMHRGIRPG